jgi:hypothetical protein
MVSRITGRGWLLLVLLTLGSGFTWCAEDDTPGPTLAQAIAQLSEAQAQLQSAGAAANVVLPSGLTDVLIVRRTIAADWQRRIEAKAIAADDAGLRRFTAELTTLVGGLQQLGNLAQQLADAPRRFPHCLAEPAFTRYRALVGEALDQGMQAVIAGRLRDQVAPAMWFQRQSRHSTLLLLIESGHLADERYALLPRDDRWLSEYRDHLLLTRTTLERRLEQAEDEDSYRHQAVLDAYTRLLDRRVQVLQRIAECELPADAPEVVTYRRASDAQIAALGRLVGLAQGKPSEDEEHYRREEREHRQLARAEQLGEFAEQWLTFARENQATVTSVNELLAEAPAELALTARTTRAAFTHTQQNAQLAFARAVEAGDLSAALVAKQAMEHVSQQANRQLPSLEEDLAIAERETAWRKHAKDPAIAEKLREWDQRRALALAARRAAEDAADAALAASHAAERAQLLSDEAQDHAATLQDAADLQDLSELMEALDEMVELRAGAAPQQ